MKIDVVTLFPEMLKALEYGITGNALNSQKIDLTCYNPRDYTHDKHGRVDDTPYGGGPGMVMSLQPLCDAIGAAKQTQSTTHPPKTILLCPRGKTLQQALLPNFIQSEHLILVAGRYEGVDERLMQLEIDETLSIGDYIMSGGELAAMVLIDSIARLLPGVVGNAQSVAEDSFSAGLLDWPHYTRPACYESLTVPDILRSGDHRAIAHWRLKQALGQTWLKRPELLEQRECTPLEQKLLQTFINENEEKNNESHH